jgi:TRAP-type C4-dicarboxylate transport system permease small subunit
VTVSQDNVPPGAGLAGHLASLHDGLSRLSFAAAMVALSVIAVSFCYEVGARYFFSAPTIWANPFASYALCASIFLAMPELTRTSSHIALNFLEDALTPANSRRLRRALQALCAGACGLAAWITAQASWNDFAVGIVTNTYYPIPKWWLSAVIPYGMASSAIHFLRQAAVGGVRASSQGAIS